MRSLLRVQSLKMVVSYAVLFAISIACFTGAFAPGVARAQSEASPSSFSERRERIDELNHARNNSTDPAVQRQLQDQLRTLMLQQDAAIAPRSQRMSLFASLLPHVTAAAISGPLAQASAPPVVSAAPDVKSALLAGFIQYVLPVLFTALATLLGWVFVQLGKKYGTEAGTAAKNQALGHLFALAQSVVADLEATLKPQLLAATSDGVLSPDEITALRNAALVRLKALAGEKGLAEAQFILGIAAPQLEGFLMGLIERAVDAQPRKGGAELLTALGTKKLDATLAAAASGNPS